MSIKKITCPHCKESIERDEPDYPTPEEIAEKFKALIPDTGDVGDLKDELQSAEAERDRALKLVNAYEQHLDPDNVCKDPNCVISPLLKTFSDAKIQAHVDGMSRQDVRELARKHGDWPWPNFEIDDGLLGRTVKR